MAHDVLAREMETRPFDLKRLLDILISIMGLLVASPLLALTAGLIRLTMGKHVIWKQQRAGLGGRLFWIYKFRSMTDAKDDSGRLLPDSARLTSAGRLVRRFSLDELPQFWNVLRGDMSVVGPRPLVAKYLPRYSPGQRRRHEVRPGITGYAQVHGRNALTWEAKFDLDVWYVDHRSFWLDLRILGITVWKVLRREGVSHVGHATMPEFRGTESGVIFESTQS